jgi:hypothetical protein
MLEHIFQPLAAMDRFVLHDPRETGFGDVRLMKCADQIAEPSQIVLARDLQDRAQRMIEGLHGVKRAAAELTRFDGAYLRFSGEVRVEHYQSAEIVDQYITVDAIWELMYFGHARV